MESGWKWTKEKFTMVDGEKRVRELEVVEGGYPDLEFKVYRMRCEVVEVARKEKEECIMRSTIEYGVAPSAALVSSQTFTAVMQLATDYLHQNYSPKQLNST